METEEEEEQGSAERQNTAGTRPRPGERPGVGERAGVGKRPGVGERPAVGERRSAGQRGGVLVAVRLVVRVLLCAVFGGLALVAVATVASVLGPVVVRTGRPPSTRRAASGRSPRCRRRTRSS
ncbi:MULTISPECIES: hypothetical protein [unclassified Streptomyces]|uniref:hypothetical protein n=1 Tax=unclassified Streptomyces TaxID=2593676 RepID=UPI002E23E0DA